MPAAPKLPEALDQLSHSVIGAALQVHRGLGPGLLESVYETCLAHELVKLGLRTRRQANLPIVYDGLQLDGGLRLDLLVEQQLILEIKAVENLLPIHTAQLLTYLRLANLRLGLLINFNVIHLKDGIRRVAH